MKIAPILFSLILLISACKTSTSTSKITEDDSIKKVETSLIPPVYIEGDTTWTIEQRMKHYGVPGVSLAVIINGQIAWSKTYGVMNKEDQKPVTSQTLFQAGSISKPVAAFGALKLVELNKLSLDSNINTYLTSWKLPDNEFTKTKKVALKHLLNHSGGLTVHGFLGYSPDLPVPSLVQVLDGLPPANSGAIRVDKTPETSFRYSGGGYTIAQQAMIDVEQKPFPDLMKELVLSPLGMKHSTYDQPLRDSQLNYYAATGYLPDGSMTKGKRHTYPEMAAAGLWTTAEDLALFAIDVYQSYHGKSNKVLSKDMTQTMLKPFVADFIGLGLFLQQKKNTTYFGHGGWDEGFSSEMSMSRDSGHGMVILTNSNHPAFIEELKRAIAFTYKWEGWVPRYTKLDITKENVISVFSRYLKGSDEMIEIYRDGNKLMRKFWGNDPVELVKISDSTYITRENNRLFQIKADPVTGLKRLLILKPEDFSVESEYVAMNPEDHIPLDYISMGQFDQALAAFTELKKAKPKDPAVNEDRINRRGYDLLNQNKLKWAQDLFKVNMILYPSSPNVYDSYAEASMKLKEWDLAETNYKKALAMDPKNTNAEKMLETIQKEKATKQ